MQTWQFCRARGAGITLDFFTNAISKVSLTQSSQPAYANNQIFLERIQRRSLVFYAV